MNISSAQIAHYSKARFPKQKQVLTMNHIDDVNSDLSVQKHQSSDPQDYQGSNLKAGFLCEIKRPVY